MANQALDLHAERQLAAERRLQLIELRLRTLGQGLQTGLQALLAAGALAAAGALGALVVDAANDDGLVVEPFSAPAAFQSRGLTGEVLAAHLIDKLAKIDAAAHSARAVSGYRAAGAEGMTPEIPETGLSVAELRRFLRGWFGRETKIGGDLVSGPAGIAVSVRVGDAPAEVFAGRQEELDALLQRAAEAIYARTQPHRHAAWLLAMGRKDEAQTAFLAIAARSAPREAAWARLGLGAVAASRDDYAAATVAARAAIALQPEMGFAFAKLARWEAAAGRPAQALEHARTARRLIAQQRDLDPSAARAETLAMDRLIEGAGRAAVLP
jgi:tetratricopeptide (TPR) repeat protein